jgi:UDP-glucose 4-epimerase
MNSFNTVLLRYFNPIGAHESALIGELPNGVPNNLVPYITQTAAGKRKQLTVFGQDYNTKDGTCIRDFIHVTDLAEAHVAAIKYSQEMSLKSDIFNVGTGKGKTVLELIKTFERVNDIKLNYSFGPRRKGDIESIYAKTDKIENKLNWHAKKNLVQSLKDSWQWERKSMSQDI